MKAMHLMAGNEETPPSQLRGMAPYLIGMFLILFGSNFGQLLTKHFAKHEEMLLSEDMLCRFIPFIVGFSIIIYRIIVDGGAKSRRDPLSWGWLLLGLYALVNNYYIPNNNFSYESTYLVFEVLVLLLLVASNAWHESYLRVLVAISLVHAGCTLLFYVFPGAYTALIFPHVDYNSPAENYLSFMSGLGTHYSQNGIWLATGAAVTFAQLRADVRCGASEKRKKLDIIEVSVVVAALLLCGKRLHFAAGMVLIAIIYLLMSSGSIRDRVFKIAKIVVILVGAALIYKLISSASLPIVERLEDPKNYEESAGRINMWSYASILWHQYPVFGVGFGGFIPHMAQDLPYLRTLDPHNTFLQLLSELGIIGFVAYILLMALSAAQACLLLRKYYTEGENRIAMFGISYALGMIVFIAMYSFVGTPLAYAPQCSLNFFLAIAVLLYFGQVGDGIMSDEFWHIARDVPRADVSDDSPTAPHVLRLSRLPIGPITLVLGCSLAIGLLTWVLTWGFGSFRFQPKESLDDYSWAELAYISRQIAAAGSDEEAESLEARYNLVRDDGTIDPNNTKRSTRIDGTEIEYRILGFRHEKKSDGSGVTGITFGYFEPDFTTSVSDSGSNAGGWDQSSLRAYINGGYLGNYTESFVNRYLFEAGIPSNNVGPTSDPGAVWAVPGRFWILSASEVFGDGAVAGGGDLTVTQLEGAQYQIFAEGSLADVLDGQETWLRTPATFNGADFAHINAQGSLSYAPADEPKGIFVAFTL